MKAKIKFLNPSKVLHLSSGEITEPSTISYSSRMPKPGGLLCPKIFGPLKDYTCNCIPPTLKGVRHTGTTCEHCGVTILPAKVRRERIGHIVLPSPCVHPLAYNLLSDLLDITLHQFEEVLKGHIWIGWVKDKNGTIFLKDGSLVSATLKDQRDLEATKRSSMAIYHMMQLVDLERTAQLYANSGSAKANFLVKTVEEEESLNNLFLTVIPVMPVAYRPYLDQGDHKGIITNAKNDLYARVFWKKNRFIRLRDLYPLFGNLDIILQQETILLQKALNDLLIDGCEDVRGGHLKSVLQDIKGKYGLVRNKLLGKRADFSGRSVISPGPWLSMDEMGLPKKMGVELFKPWIQWWLKENYGLKTRQSEALYKKGKKRDPRLYEALEEVVKGKRLIMNRAPTLHRIGMLSFKIVLHDGHSCLLHPMVCAPYNADFDGDQMAVHIPLSKVAEEEVENYMKPKDNFLSPLDSSPVIGPSHEMIIGTYYMTRIDEDPTRHYDNPLRVIQDHERGMFDVNTPVYLYEYSDEAPRITCAGRLMFERLFKVEINEPLTKRALKRLISSSYDTISTDALALALDKLKILAYDYVTRKGFSIGMTDFLIPSTRDHEMEQAQAYVDTLKEECELGFITEEERVERKIRRWMKAITKLQDDFIKEAGQDNSLVVMLETGARVSMTQVSQLVVAKGMQAKAGGSIIEDPVKNCLMTGVNTFEYFTTSYGARKSMADKKMATPTSGYLARRLVNVTRDFYISVRDCGNTREGLPLKRCQSVGRTTLDGELITKNKSQEIVKVRSPIFCTAERGICTVCYGDDQTTRSRIEIGEPVGIIAAQSLTEPCTQMTMKTFHTSGAAELKDSTLVVRAKRSGIVTVKKGEEHTIINVNFDKYMVHTELCKILVPPGERVNEGDPLAVYTSKNLVNEDIGGKLNVLTQYFEMARCRGQEAIVSQRNGEVQLVIDESGICILVDGEYQGQTDETPVFVYEGEYVKKGQFLSYGEVNVKNVEDLETAAIAFVHRMLELYAEEGVNSAPVHLEMIFRGLSEIVEDEETGELGLFRYGDPGIRRVYGAIDLGKDYPSWLKAIGFGYSKSALTKAATSYAVTYDLPTERIMMGQYPLFDPVEGEDE